MSGSIEDRLKELPLRAVVAAAARCARRVQPLTGRLPEQGRDAVDRAIRAAEEFARGNPLLDTAAYVDARDNFFAASGAFLANLIIDKDKSFADYAAAHAALTAAEVNACAYAAAFADYVDAAYRAANAMTAAHRAADSATKATNVAGAAVQADLDRLAILKLGRPPTRGLPIDPSEGGPLGSLWPYGAPLWYLNPPRPDEE